MKINEGGKSFNEFINIKMTKFGKAVITDVPNHRNGKYLFVCVTSKQHYANQNTPAKTPKAYQYLMVFHTILTTPRSIDQGLIKKTYMMGVGFGSLSKMASPQLIPLNQEYH